MKRIIPFVALALACFMIGSLFTIGVGTYLAGDSSEAPAVIQPSSFGRAI